jgi:uncharacterized protein
VDESIEHILTAHRRIAMVGASSNPGRPSHGVMRTLMSAGYDVIPVNPTETEVLGVPAAADLAEAARRGPLEIVNIFRRPAEVPEIVAQAIPLGAQVIWMQLGIRSEEGARTARDAGLAVVQNRCLASEYGKLAAAGKA